MLYPEARRNETDKYCQKHEDTDNLMLFLMIKDIHKTRFLSRKP